MSGPAPAYSTRKDLYFTLVTGANKTVDVLDTDGNRVNAEFFELRATEGDGSAVHFTEFTLSETLVAATAEKMFIYPNEDRFQKPAMLGQLDLFTASAINVKVFIRLYGYRDMSGSTVT